MKEDRLTQRQLEYRKKENAISRIGDRAVLVVLLAFFMAPLIIQLVPTLGPIGDMMNGGGN